MATTWQGKVTTNGGGLNIRSGTSTSTKIVGKIPNGTDIKCTTTTVDDKGNIWAKITYNGQFGYICVKEGSNSWVRLDKQLSKTPETKPSDTKAKKDSDIGTSKGIENGLQSLMNTSVNNGKAIQATTRLFGMPFQFPKHIDNRIPNVSELLGRKYIENIVLTAPILTIVPGKPVYLPGAKNKTGTSQALISAANGSFSELAALGKSLSADKLRYFDFEQDYHTYIKYVNVLCRVAAGFLELGDTKLDGTPLSKYDWKQYRFTGTEYVSAADNISGAIQTAASNIVGKAVNGVKNLVNKAQGKEGNSKYEAKVFFDNGEQSAMDKLESLMKSTNYVQFYIDPSSNIGESASNATSQSKLEGIFDTAGDFMKELSFVVNAGGGDAAALQNFAQSSSGALADQVNKISNGGITGFFSRILSSASNILGGQNMIIPEIYQSSDFGKSYNITLDFRSPYNDIYSFYMNILVPVLHIIALVCPKQASANTYSSPFLIKAFLPGVGNCNLGIVESISIEKEGCNVDGLPTSIKVSLGIKDLYSELMITPSNEPLLFLSNSSLIDYLATSCGLDMTKPQLSNKIEYLTGVLGSSFEDIPENVSGEIKKKIDDMVAPWIAIS